MYLICCTRQFALWTVNLFNRYSKMSLYSFAEYNRLISWNNKVIIACPLPGEVIQIQHIQGIVCPTYPLVFKTSHISTLKASHAHYFGEIKASKCHGSSSAELSLFLSGVACSTLILIHSCHLQPLQLQVEVTGIQVCSAPSVPTPVWSSWVIHSLVLVAGNSSQITTDLREKTCY